MKAIHIIQDEHRSITAVVEGMRQIVREIEAGRLAPDFDLLDAMLRYIEVFPERLHHPKEDDFLFAKLRVRRPDAGELLDGLSAEHKQGRAKFAELKAAVAEYREHPDTMPSLVERVERYAHFHWKHMRREEDEVLPLAAASLTPDDWNAIDSAFLSNSDPVVGIAATREFRALFRHVVSLAPPPFGVGPETRT